MWRCFHAIPGCVLVGWSFSVLRFAFDVHISLHVATGPRSIYRACLQWSVAARIDRLRPLPTAIG